VAAPGAAGAAESGDSYSSDEAPAATGTLVDDEALQRLREQLGGAED
jgi:hypothetical protein